MTQMFLLGVSQSQDPQTVELEGSYVIEWRTVPKSRSSEFFWHCFVSDATNRFLGMPGSSLAEPFLRTCPTKEGSLALRSTNRGILRVFWEFFFWESQNRTLSKGSANCPATILRHRTLPKGLFQWSGSSEFCGGQSLFKDAARISCLKFPPILNERYFGGRLKKLHPFNKVKINLK